VVNRGSGDIGSVSVSVSENPAKQEIFFGGDIVEIHRLCCM
jgi:hypothetical protein